MSETNREDGTTDEGSFDDPTPNGPAPSDPTPSDPTSGDPTSGSRDWQPRSWEAPGTAPSEQSEPDASSVHSAESDLTQEVQTDSTRHIPSADGPPGDEGAPQHSAAPGPQTDSAPPPMPYPAPGQANAPGQASAPGQGTDTDQSSPAYPPAGQPSPYGASAYPPPPPAPGVGAPPAPGVGAPPAPPAPGAYGAYGSTSYADPNATYGAPPPAYYQQAPSQTNNSALVLTILSGVGIFACCGVTIVSLILGILGLTKQASDPAQSAKLTKWGWIAFAAGLALAVLALIGWVAGVMVWAPETYIEPDF